jgi:hypothetical protein
MSPRLTSSSSARRTVTACGRRRLERAVEGVDAGDRRRAPGRQDDDLVADAQGAAGDRAGVAAVVGPLGRHRPDDVLHREARGPGLAVVALDVHALEVLEQRRPVVPGHRRAAVHDVVALQRRHRDRGDVGSAPKRVRRSSVSAVKSRTMSA